MPRSTAIKNYFTFVGGLNTEAGALTFPENASLDEDNCILNIDGSRHRRRGIDYEDSYSLSSDIPLATIDEQSIYTGRWDNVAANPEINFLVVQVGSTIYFHSFEAGALSATAKSFTIDMATYQAPNAANIGNNIISTAVGNGKLFISAIDMEPIMVSYVELTDTIDVTQLDIKIRDFAGVDDSLAVDERIETLSTEHQYNLQNQGWDDTQYDAYETSKSLYPSNADIWTAGKDSSDDFDPSLLDKQFFGTSPAPKGRYVLDAFNKDRNTASGLTGLASITEDSRPSTIEFFAGRLFYSGAVSTNDDTPHGAIYFSRLLGSGADLAVEAQSCYQEADPTSEIFSDLLDTDGGVITIPEAGAIYKILVVKDSLIVLSDSGVWQILGSADTGFVATSYFAKQITDTGAVNAESIVRVEGSVLYWAKGGIYALNEDQVSGSLVATNTSTTTIQTFYNDIESTAKQYCKGAYDSSTKKVYWLYTGDDTFDGVTNRYKYEKMIVLDTTLGAYYTFTYSSLDTRSPFITSMYVTNNFSIDTVDQNVVAGPDLVTANSVQVIVEGTARTAANAQVEYLVAEPQVDGTNYKYTFARLKDTTFHDWQSADTVTSTGESFSSYLETGYETLGDGIRDKEANYIFCFFNRTEDGYTAPGAITYTNPSSCLIQARWGWSDHSDSGKWGSKFQAYRLKNVYLPDNTVSGFDYGYNTITTKNKLRGTGQALSIRFESEEGKDMQLLGWSIPFTAGNAP